MSNPVWKQRIPTRLLDIVRDLSQTERRTIGQMFLILLEEALIARKLWKA